MKKRDIILIVSGAVAASVGAAMGILALKTNKDINKMDFDHFIDGKEEEIPERTYINLSEKVSPLSKFKKGKKEKNIEEKIDTFSNEELNLTEVYFDDFFKSDVLVLYKDFINVYFEKEGQDSLKYVKNRDIFNIVGEFDYDYLKKSFIEQYENIRQIMTSEIYSLPMECLPIDKYIGEIEKYEQMEICEEKIVGTLSYWAAINGSLGQGTLI